MPESYLVLVNPIGGKKQGLNIWETVLKPALEKNGDSFELVKTTHSGHATELGEAIDTNKFTGVISIGGDGMFSQFVDGLYKWKGPDGKVVPVDDEGHAFASLKLVIVPAGTGNGMGTSVGLKTPADTAAALTNGSFAPLDILRVAFSGNKCDGDVHSSTLSVSWGAIADHDAVAETTLRWMGGLRLLLVPVYLIANNKKYRLKLKYTIAETGKTVDREGDFSLVTTMNVSSLASDCFFAPESKAGDGLMHLVLFKAGTRVEMLKAFTGMETGKHIESPNCEVIKISSLEVQPVTAQGNVVVDGEYFDVWDPETTVKVDVHKSLATFASGVSE